MRLFAYVVGFTGVWLALAGPSPSTLVAGLALSMLIVRVEGVPLKFASPARLLRASRAVARLTVLFAWEMLVANVEQLVIVSRPRIDIRPQWFCYPMRLSRPELQAVLGVLISMTPGTITCDIDPERQHILVHGLTVSDLGATIARIGARLERPLLEVETA